MPDPIGLAGGINGYVYVYNNPLGLIDPLGLCADGNGSCIDYCSTDPDSLLAAVFEQFSRLFARSVVEVGSNVATAGAISIELDYNLNPSLQKGYGVQLNNKLGDTSYLIQAGIPVTRPIGAYYSLVNSGFEAYADNWNPAASFALGQYGEYATRSPVFGIAVDYTVKEVLNNE